MSTENQENTTSAQATTNMANLRYGVYHQNGSFVGMTVAQARQQLTNAWGIPGDATAYKGKVKMEDNYVIQPGDQLEFHRRMGEKG